MGQPLGYLLSPPTCFYSAWCGRRLLIPGLSRWATKNEQVASLWFVLTHSQGIAPLSEEHALQFTPFWQLVRRQHHAKKA